jgi:hypothetical protein
LGDLVGDEAVVEMGMDDASLDGLYGRKAASRDIGRGFNVAYITKVHAKSLEHSVELGNKRGYARLMKSGDVVLMHFSVCVEDELVWQANFTGAAPHCVCRAKRLTTWNGSFPSRALSKVWAR